MTQLFSDAAVTADALVGPRGGGKALMRLGRLCELDGAQLDGAHARLGIALEFIVWVGREPGSALTLDGCQIKRGAPRVQSRSLSRAKESGWWWQTCDGYVI